ncbi:Hypp9148 [Branchiostoma lanceolatum]|uniref:Hypp9148 protein n=1 Tax=Branchiostoma lanceolatum TaxID=7740 RepID=A0A8K0EKM9_BRALA|nr:Hypp9148 [Branchiostoma lanceolatum]
MSSSAGPLSPSAGPLRPSAGPLRPSAGPLSLKVVQLAPKVGPFGPEEVFEPLSCPMALTLFLSPHLFPRAPQLAPGALQL